MRLSNASVRAFLGWLGQSLYAYDWSSLQLCLRVKALSVRGCAMGVTDSLLGCILCRLVFVLGICLIRCRPGSLNDLLFCQLL